MPEHKEKYDARFWVYQNWNSKDTTHANIHIPWCGHCRDGEGHRNSKKSKNNWTPDSKWKWIDCDNYEEALEALENFKKERNCKPKKAKDCYYCRPGNRQHWYLDS